MTLRARFGLAGHDRQTYLPGTDPALLPDPTGLDAPPHPKALDPAVFTPDADGTKTLFSGRVATRTTGHGTADERSVFDVTGPWNSVKNAAVVSDGAARLAFLGFVHVDAALGLSSVEGSVLEVVGAKRGNLLTGAGDGRIDVQVATNGRYPHQVWWSNEFRVATGAGDDEVRFSVLDLLEAEQAGDATFDWEPRGTGPQWFFGGGPTAAWIDLGPGEDTLAVEGWIRATVSGGDGDDDIRLDSAGTVEGGDGEDTVLGAGSLSGDAGDDTLTGRGARDTLLGGEGDDRLDGSGLLEGGEGDDTVSGTGAADTLSGGEGDDALSGGVGWDTAAFAGQAASYAIEVRSSAGRRAVAVRDLDPGDGDEGTDTLTGVERLRFADRTVELPLPDPPGGRAVFGATDADGTTDALWVTDGTAEGTVPLAVITPRLSGFRESVQLGDGRMLFTAFGPSGRELWATDGTPGGTAKVSDITGGAGSWDDGFGFFDLGGGRALFTFGGYRHELWVTDGTAAGTAKVPGVGDAGTYGLGFAALGDGRALFAASDAGHGRELWVTDGTLAGTALVRDINPRPPADTWSTDGGSAPSQFVPLGGGRAVFTADGDGNGGGELWVTDGTEAGTSLVRDVRPSGEYGFQPVALGGGRALFTVGDGLRGRELWVTDGTVAGTAEVPGAAGPTYTSPERGIGGLVALGDGRVLFASDGGEGRGDRLWVTDGTAAGTAMLRDAASVAGAGGYGVFVALGDGRALFTHDDGAHGREPWVTDGTAAGTAMLRDVHPGAGTSYPGEWVPLGDGRALFTASRGDGTELWVTDGKEAGTAMVGDVRPAENYGWPVGFEALGDGRALFAANDGAHGREPWITDGTAAGTAMLRDIDPAARTEPDDAGWPSPGHSFPSNFTSLGGGRALFTAVDGVHGRELWVTDGTEAGTSLLDLEVAGWWGSNPYGFTLIEPAGADAQRGPATPSGIDPFS